MEQSTIQTTRIQKQFLALSGRFSLLSVPCSLRSHRPANRRQANGYRHSLAFSAARSRQCVGTCLERKINVLLPKV